MGGLVLLCFCWSPLATSCHDCSALVVSDEDPELSGAPRQAVRLCVRPSDWLASKAWWIGRRTQLPSDPVAKAAFLAYCQADRLSLLVFDRREAVLLFCEVYRERALEFSGGAPFFDVLPRCLPTFKQGHVTGADLVFEKRRRVVFFGEFRRVSHRLAMAVGTWELEMCSWRARDRCGRYRGVKHDVRKLLDRPLTDFRLFAMHLAYTLCPKCGLRNFARPFGWSVRDSLDHSDAFVRRIWERSVVYSCRMHAESRFTYAVPDLLSESPIPGSPRRRWTYWPRFNETRGVFEELVSEENREWTTFLDFGLEERQAMQCLLVYCDFAEDWVLSALSLFVFCVVCVMMRGFSMNVAFGTGSTT